MTVPQKFCRRCGLRLDKIAEELMIQLPTAAHGDLLRRARQSESGGIAALALFGLLILSFVIYAIAGGSFKSLPILFVVPVVVMMLSGLAAVFMFNYATHLREKVQSPLRQKNLENAAQTAPLLEEKPFEPASVTERTTDLLYAEKLARKTDELA